MRIGPTIQPTQQRRRCSGTLSVEMFVAVVIMGALFGLMATFGGALKKVDDYHWTRYTLANAAQSQMDAIAATGKPIEAADFSRLWPGIACEMTISGGTGQWSGLQQVRLDLSAKSRHKVVRVELKRYITHEKDPGHDR